MRGEKVLPITSVIETTVGILERNSSAANIIANVQALAETHHDNADYMASVVVKIPEALEALIQDGWVKASYDPSQPLPPQAYRVESMRWNTDTAVRS